MSNIKIDTLIKMLKKCRQIKDASILKTALHDISDTPSKFNTLPNNMKSIDLFIQGIDDLIEMVEQIIDPADPLGRGIYSAYRLNNTVNRDLQNRERVLRQEYIRNILHFIQSDEPLKSAISQYDIDLEVFFSVMGKTIEYYLSHVKTAGIIAKLDKAKAIEMYNDDDDDYI